jgi:hypothetical protein
MWREWREKRTAYGLQVEKLEGKRLLGRRRRRWMGNIMMDIMEIVCGGVDWIGQAQVHLGSTCKRRNESSEKVSNGYTTGGLSSSTQSA